MIRRITDPPPERVPWGSARKVMTEERRPFPSTKVAAVVRWLLKRKGNLRLHVAENRVRLLSATGYGIAWRARSRRQR